MPRTVTSDDDAETVRTRLKTLLSEVHRLNAVSRDTTALLRRLAECLDDDARSDRVFKEIERKREAVDALSEAFEFVNQINQLGAFKRYLADRRIDIRSSDDPRDMQRLQIERDQVNVEFLEQAGIDAAEMLEDSIRLLDPQDTGTGVVHRIEDREDTAPVELDPLETRPTDRVSAFIPIDPLMGGAGSRRSLRKSIAFQGVLQTTLERIGVSQSLDSIILLVRRMRSSR